jgi:hypothetical protein
MVRIDIGGSADVGENRRQKSGKKRKCWKQINEGNEGNEGQEEEGYSRVMNEAEQQQE